MFIFPFELNLLDLVDGSNGFVINGINEFDNFGGSVSSAGDVNGDGLDDLIIGAPFANPNGNRSAGSSYVVFGSRSGFSPSLELSELDGSNGFVINGIDEFDNFGGSVSSAGDVNGDGLDDLIIGVPSAEPTWETYVVFGNSSSFSSSLELSELDGSNGFVINGIDEVDSAGLPVSDAGDINGDGIDDLIIGARGVDSNDQYSAGSSYVVFGSRSGFSPSLELSELDGSNGFVINGIDRVGFLSSGSVSNAGDVNGDSIDDLLISAVDFDILVQEAYVVFGSRNGFSPSLELSELDGSNGFVLIDRGFELVGVLDASVSSAGDVNGDGLDDIIIAAPFADPTGETYVVFGANRNLFFGTEDDDLLNGTAAIDSLNGLAGDDTINGLAGFDFIFGGVGDDLITAGEDNDRASGESGNDTIFGNEGDDVLIGGFDNDYLEGGDGSDWIIGGLGDDTLIGVDLSSPESLFGQEERDILYPNRRFDSSGRDTFILGNEDTIFYSEAVGEVIGKIRAFGPDGLSLDDTAFTFI